jgi:autotransporter-associated beta strand protein
MKHASCALFALSLCLSSTQAINIADYSPETNALFSSGFSGDSPIRNTGPSFQGAGYNWSAVGWLTDVAGGGRVSHLTLVSPIHTLSARHNNVNILGSEARFVNEANEVIDVRLTGLSTQAFADLNVAPLVRAVTEAETVTPMRILDVSSENFAGLPALMVGSDGSNVGSMVATTNIIGISSSQLGSTLYDSSGNVGFTFERWEPGDSGSPALIPHAGELTLAGTAWFASGGFSRVPTALGSDAPGVAVNATMATSGYALKWMIYDNPADTANTASRWIGGGGNGNILQGANWSVPTRVENKPVIFDGAAAGSQADLEVGSDYGIRGMLFRGGNSDPGFLFQGPGTLEVGMTGIRNEAAATQVFHLPVRLSNSQNWDAVGGDLEFSGNIDNGGYLLAVGGNADTLIAGVISGAGGLAKDGSGTLTVNATNTYTGTTFLHGGTIRLESNGNLSVESALVFDAGNPALLDLNGRNQTLRNLTSATGGTGRIALGGATLTVNMSATGVNSFLGDIEGNGSVIKSGTGLWSLGGENTYSGQTQLLGGVIRLASDGALSANSNLHVNGGVLELGAGDFTRSLGTGAGEIQFVGGGGFSAVGGDRVVNLGGSGTTLTWGSGGFVAGGSSLTLSSVHADSTVEIQNGIDLGGTFRVIFVEMGGADADARISGSISNGILIKSGNGNLDLTGQNTYTGQTQVNGGGLQVSSAGALGTGNLSFNGGVLILADGDFHRALGTGSGQVQFAGNGGFAAHGGERVVDFGGEGSMVTWGTGGFVADGRNFLLSTAASDSTIVLSNGIDLNGAARTIQANNGTAGVDARIDGVLSNGSLLKTGAGTLELTGNNTYSGQTQINGGGLLITNGSALGVGNLSLNSGGVLVLGVGDFTRDVGSGAGEVRFAGSGGFAAYGATRTVNIGGAGATQTWGSAGFVPLGNALYLGSDGANGTVNFVNGLNLAGTNRTIWVNDGSAVVDGVLSGVMSNGGLTKGGAGLLELTAINTYAGETRIDGGVLRISTAGALSSSSNLTFSQSGVLELASGDFSRSIGTGAGQVRFVGSGGFSAFGGNRTVNLGGAGATVVWGAVNSLSGRLVLSSTSSDSTLNWQNPINLGTSAAGTRIIEVHDGSATIDATINGVISTGGVGWGIQKLGQGTLELAAATSYTGDTIVSQGTLVIGSNGTLSSTREVTIEGGTLDYQGNTGLNRRVELQGGRFAYNSAAAYTGTLIFESGTIGGSGNLGTTMLSIGSGQIISPGNSAGTLTTGTQTWLDGGTYHWEITSLVGSAGVAWDLVNIQGDLNILASTEGFTIELNSLGILSGWDPSQSHSWQIAAVGGTMSRHDTGLVAIDASGFAVDNNLEGGGFGLQMSGDSLSLVFTPVPEPSPTVLVGLALFFLRLRRTRRNF